MLGSRAVRLALSPVVSVPRYERRRVVPRVSLDVVATNIWIKIKVQCLFVELRGSYSTSLHLLQSSCTSPCSCGRFPCRFVFCILNSDVLQKSKYPPSHQHSYLYAKSVYVVKPDVLIEILVNIFWPAIFWAMPYVKKSQFVWRAEFCILFLFKFLKHKLIDIVNCITSSV